MFKETSIALIVLLTAAINSKPAGPLNGTSSSLEIIAAPVDDGTVYGPEPRPHYPDVWPLPRRYLSLTDMDNPQNSAEEVYWTDNYTKAEKVCLAMNTYFESRSENRLGRIATAWNVLTRVERPEWPSNICDVVKQARYYTNKKGNRIPRRHLCAYSWWCDGKPDIPHEVEVYTEILELVTDILDGKIADPTGGSTHYHTVELEERKGKPWWVARFDLEEIGIFDAHIHYRMPRQVVSSDD